MIRLAFPLAFSLSLFLSLSLARSLCISGNARGTRGGERTDGQTLALSEARARLLRRHKAARREGCETSVENVITVFITSDRFDRVTFTIQKLRGSTSPEQVQHTTTRIQRARSKSVSGLPLRITSRLPSPYCTHLDRLAQGNIVTRGSHLLSSLGLRCLCDLPAYPEQIHTVRYARIIHG